MNLAVAVVLLVVLCCSPIHTVDPSVITDSLSLANDLGGFIAGQDFSKTATRLISSVSPFLGVIGSVLSFVFGFADTGPSPELLAIQKLYKETTIRFNHIDSEFAAVTREMKWISIEVHYGDYESAIHVIGETYQQLVASASKLEFESRKALFIQAFNSYQKAGEKIFDGIIGQSYLFNGPIFDEAARHLQGDRMKMQQFMLGVAKLLIDAATIEIAFYHLTDQHNAAEFIKHDWIVRFHTLQYKMKQKDSKLSTVFHPYLRTDVEDFAINHEHSSNCDYANQLYDFVAKKYYWLSWIVIVTDKSSDPHMITLHGGTCNGAFNDHHSKNVYLANVNPRKPHLTSSQQKIINNVQTYHTFRIPYYVGKRDLQKRVYRRRVNADEAFNTFLADARNSKCNQPYSSFGIIDHHLHFCHKAAPNRFFTRYDGSFHDVFVSG